MQELPWAGMRQRRRGFTPSVPCRGNRNEQRRGATAAGWTLESETLSYGFMMYQSRVQTACALLTELVALGTTVSHLT